MIDFHPLETEAFVGRVLALDWDRLIPGHPGPGDRLGTKKDAAHQLQLLRTASAEMKKLAQAGKCWDAAEAEFKLPMYVRKLAGLCSGAAVHCAALLRVVGAGDLSGGE